MESKKSVVAAEAAHAVIRKFFVPLYKAVTDDYVQMELYSRELIDKATLKLGESERGRRILFDLQEKISQNMDDGMIDKLCQILNGRKDDQMDSLVQEVRTAYEKELETRESASKAQSSGRNELQCLKKQLEAFKLTSQMPNPPDGLNTVIERTLQNYIETSLEASLTADTIQEQLNELESLLDSDMLKWALLELDNTVKRQAPPCAEGKEIAPIVQEITSPVEAGAPPLSHSILYHASLVCQAVNTCGSTRSVQEFLKQENHELCEASLSQPLHDDDIDRYIIAKNGSTIYVAFRSKPSLNSWQKQYKSFEDGLKDQTMKIPIRFFIEQLLKKNQIVFTGFSYGGLLASCFTSHLWRAGILLSEALLQKNVMCVTFGQPLISIPFVASTILRFPALENTIHLVLNKQDKVPGILYYFRLGCILKAQDKRETPCPTTDNYFEGSFSTEFVHALCTLQERATKPSYSSAVQHSPTKIKPAKVLAESMRDLIAEGASKMGSPEMLFGKFYLMKPEGNKKVVCEVTKALVFKELLRDALTEEIKEASFKLHTAEDYRQKIIVSNEPPASTPSTTVTRLQDVSFLKPKPTTIEFHLYPNEHVIVLEGNNLWFCHKVCIGRHENSIVIDSPSNIVRRSIQFNFKPSELTEKLCENGGVHVTLYSHFAQEISKRLHAKKEPYSFSLRQIQLAKQTPTEIIQLAYCTAMLEQSLKQTTATNQPMTSKRYEAVKSFLEETGKIVPLESVFHVIAHSSKDTALQCGKALQASDLNFPPSYMMLICSHQAAMRVTIGQTLEEFKTEKRKSHVGQVHELELMVPVASIAIPKSESPNPLFGSLATDRASKPVHHPNLSSADQKQSLPLSRNRLYSEVAEKMQIPQGLPYMNTLNLLFPASRHCASSSSLAQRQSQMFHEVPEMLHMPPVMPPAATIRSSLALREHIPPLDSELAAFLQRVYMEIERKARSRGDELPLISSRSIEQFCPFSLKRHVPGATLQSPIQALIDARQQLLLFSQAAQRNEIDNQSSSSALKVNEEMIQVVKRIQEFSLSMCSALLAAFMEQQIRIPLIKTHQNTAKVLSSAHNPVAMGSWAFISMDLGDIGEILTSSEGSPLLVEIGDYITSVIEQAKKVSNVDNRLTEFFEADIKYADKLLFLVHGIKAGNTVSCSTQFISYSLECQLHQLSKELKFDKTLTVKKLVAEWSTVFKNNALSLVASTHRPLIARWLKWALLIHDLRETLAEYTCVGTIGLSNSGKSHLVNTLFDVQAHVGTTEKKRTVVPFLYNMDGRIDKLDVIDFPGVDDVNTVPEVTKLLVNLAQIVIFVVDYRNIGSKISVEWIKRLGNEDVQVLVCLTHADILYLEVKKELQVSDSINLKHRIEHELAQTVEKVGRHPSRTMKYYCFDLPSNDKNLSFQALKEVGIYSPKDVGEWLVETFNHNLAQPDLAEKLRKYLNSRSMS